jgi:hypothetical protein
VLSAAKLELLSLSFCFFKNSLNPGFYSSGGGGKENPNGKGLSF